MTKTECDVCGKPIEVSVTKTRLKGKVKIRKKTVQFEIMAGVEGTLNLGDLCEECLKMVLVSALGKFPVRGEKAEAVKVEEPAAEKPKGIPAK